jgi:hypothetical protein
MKEFNSQVCTSREQSERLLALGLKPETADMYWWDGRSWVYDSPFCADDEIPAWSLHRLIEMMPSVIYREGRLDYYLNVNRDGVIYDRMGIACIEYIYDNLFDNIVLCIEWLIKEGYFSKEYLCEK